MASAALSAENIRLLAEKGTPYWEDEASVNGIWVGLLAKAFPGSDSFVLQPEGQGEGGRMRNDILVRKIINFESGKQEACLVFEGKSSTGDSLDQAVNQLLVFVKTSPKLNEIRKLWGIIARGTEFRLLFFHDLVPHELQLRRPDLTDPDTGRPSLNKTSTIYNLMKPGDKAGSVESVQLFLAYASTHLDWTG